MRTTVTLDSDVERLIREAMHRSRKSFKQTLNDAVRQSLMKSSAQAPNSKFVVKSRPLGLLNGIDPAALSDLDTDIEVEQFKRTTNRLVEKQK